MCDFTAAVAAPAPGYFQQHQALVGELNVALAQQDWTEARVIVIELDELDKKYHIIRFQMGAGGAQSGNGGKIRFRVSGQ